MIRDEPFWDDARQRISRDPRKVNLNAGTLSPTPLPVLDAVTALRKRMAENPSDFHWRQTPALIERSRARLAAYLDCDPRDLLLLPNITFALNLVTTSLRLRRGSEILTTDHEYGAMLHAWRRLAERDGLTVRTIELPYLAEDPAELIDAMERGINDETRILFFSHVTTTTGLVMPVTELCALARERGLLSVIDGAHGPGMVPVNLADLRADFYAGNCHKWLMAPPGAGFLHVRPHRKSMLSPIITSWGYDHTPDRADLDSGCGGTCRQWNMEFHGTADRTPQMVLPECLDFRESLGGDAGIANRVRSLSEHARQSLVEIGLKHATPRNAALSGGAVTAFHFPCDDPIAARDYFWNIHHIECPVTTAAGQSFLRVSTAWFNTVEEIDQLGAAVRDWMQRQARS